MFGWLKKLFVRKVPETEVNLLILMKANGGTVNVRESDGAFVFNNLKTLDGKLLVCTSVETLKYYATIYEEAHEPNVPDMDGD